MCFNNNRRVTPKLMIPLEIIFQQMSIFLTGTVWNNRYLLYTVYVHIYTHTHTTHYIARGLCSKFAGKKVYQFQHKITRGSALAGSSNSHQTLDLALSFGVCFVHRTILRMPHSQQNLAHSTGYLVPHSWQNLGKCPEELPSKPFMFPPLSEDTQSPSGLAM